jgi:hypothetical protein
VTSAARVGSRWMRSARENTLAMLDISIGEQQYRQISHDRLHDERFTCMLLGGAPHFHLQEWALRP